ncbi:26S proteasome regulatory complex [Volvox carteri f. nagariensis]|uniref:26S proteasome regulatory subunit RPN7 n=1 Tax=Volvox carteri f. nagariensis TaxID=3068 RepID=D8TR02_VOLCA|nr:26S proteasome regulatory complex [Volvox carteri f. nagariensis]EFJ50115.1 26S proteasome regulatory complex [Volvox carteri f. nagariensis]|eukprot:XP_002948735.1 26S proteasome regulatory complex [Volvox carteri f. nagariensis]
MEEVKQDFRLELAHKVFLIKTPDIPVDNREVLKKEVLAVIYEGNLAPLYQYLCSELGWTLDSEKLGLMQAANAAKLAEFDEKQKDAEENLGETEVRDVMLARAEYLGSISDREAASQAFDAVEKKTASGGNKVDLLFSQIRLFILYGDWRRVKTLIARAQSLCEEGGDWERKNKLKVYQGVLAMYTRQFAAAADLLLDSTATFTASELFPYSWLIFYAVVVALPTLSRSELKKRVVDSPEVLSVIHSLPGVQQLLEALYHCKYRQFFSSFLEVIEEMRRDMYLHHHVRHYSRELRAVAYTQFLESYKSVTLESMASAFDVSSSFLDAELVDFICSGRLHAKIDKVAGVIETNRPDAKNALYADTLKKGDLLLNRVQKLSRVIDME